MNSYDFFFLGKSYLKQLLYQLSNNLSELECCKKKKKKKKKEEKKQGNKKVAKNKRWKKIFIKIKKW